MSGGHGSRAPAAVPLGDVLAGMCRSETMRRAAALHARVFSRLDAERTAMVNAVLAFFRAVCDAHAALDDGTLTDTMRTLLPGAHAERALEHVRAVQRLLLAKGVPNDRRAATEHVERVRLWLEAQGWLLLPRDTGWFEGGGHRTAAGLASDMDELAAAARRTTATMAAAIAAKRGGRGA